METTLKQAFALGLLVGVAANLVADAISGHVRDEGYTNRHVLFVGLAFFGIFLLIWSAERG